MMTRVGRGMRAAAVAAVFGLAVTACESPVPGSPTAGEDQFEYAAQQAFDQAVSALASRPVMRYTSTVAGATDEKISIAVTKSGSVYGTSNVDGRKMTLAVLGGKLYVRTDKKAWGQLGAKPSEAKEFANRFVVTDPEDVGFDPGTLLTPQKVADRLKDEATTEPGEERAPSQPSSTEPQLSRGKVERLKLDDGTEVYRVPVGDYTADVTVSKPHTLVSTNVPLGQTGSDPLVPSGARTSFDDVGENQLRTLFKSLSNAVKGLRNAGVLVPNFQLRQGSGKLDCAVGGKCTAKVKVSNSYPSGAELPVTQFDVKLNVTMVATGLGTKRCSDSAGMRPNSSISMSCSANFNLAPSYTPRSYPVRATWAISATAKYKPQVAKLRAAVDRELDELLDEI